jgi:hypothetical protein
MTQNIKDDTEVIRSHIEVLNFNTDEILARVRSTRKSGPSPHNNRRVEEWMEDMTLLSTYAESTYRSTIADPAEFASHAVVPTLNSLTEVDQQEDFEPQTTSPTSQSPPDVTQVTEETRLSIDSSSTPKPLNDTSMEELHSDSGSNFSAQFSDSSDPRTNPPDDALVSEVSCDALEECSRQIQEARLLVRLDEQLIEKSRKARERLSEG